MTQHTDPEIPSAPTYAMGFKTLEAEVSIGSLPTTGKFPSWLVGTLVRNGPGKFEAGRDLLDHHFDGFAMLHRFTFGESGVSYANRFIQSRSFEFQRREGHLGAATFSRAAPLAWEPRAEGPAYAKAPDVNPAVTVECIAGEHVALTDGSPVPVRFDLSTLETLGALVWEDDLQIRDCAGNAVDSRGARPTTAHCHRDANGDVINYYVQPGAPGRPAAYNFYRASKGTRRRERLAWIPTDHAAYVHSFCVTERYIVFPESPLRSDPARFVGRGGFARTLYWRADAGMILHVIDKTSGKVVRRFEVRPCFVMHTINAFEDGETIVLDMATYDDARHIDELYFEPSLRPPGGRYPNARVPELRSHSRPCRFRLNLATGEADEEVLAPVTIELPTINYARYNGRRNRFFYSTGISNDPQARFYDQLASMDTETGDVATWRSPGCFPGEPVFVPRPGADAEDDGILLSLVLNGASGRSHLMALQPRTLEEIARVELPHHVPSGFHGRFFPQGAQD
jgi:beta,beta-carotene 9',10'-dioxygenase